MASSKVAIGAPGTTQGSIYESTEASQIIASIFDTSLLCIAVFDKQHRFIAVNKTLAALHGIPAKDHVGKTLREVVPQASVKAESLMDRVFNGDESVRTEEITVHMPTRNEDGHWIVSFVPIKDESGQVSQVCTIAIEATHQVMLAECLRGLMNRLPQVRDHISWAYVSSQTKAVDPLVLVQSAEILEQCVRTIQKFSGLVQALAPASSAENEGDPGQSSIPFAESLAPSGNEHLASVGGPGTITELTPREVEVVTLLVASRSNKEISNILNLSVKTVETYRTRIMSKLQIHSMSELVLYAVRHHLIQP
jgi:PAS domain S-box-containing protein